MYLPRPKDAQLESVIVLPPSSSDDVYFSLSFVLSVTRNPALRNGNTSNKQSGSLDDPVGDCDSVSAHGSTLHDSKGTASNDITERGLSGACDSSWFISALVTV